MNKNPGRTLDFKLLPVIESMDIFMRLDQEVENSFKKLNYLQETYERAKASIMFFFQIIEKNEVWMNDAYFGAGLNEFYSLEAAILRDLRAAEINVKPIAIRQSCNPHLHLMYILRHVGVHSKPVRTEVKSINLMTTLGRENHDYSYGAIVLKPITISNLYLNNDALNYYISSDLEKIIKWFNFAQQVFGASDVFRRGVSDYCQEIVMGLPRQ